MSLCKHPEEVCCSMTFYHGKVYCDNTNGFCQLHDEPLPETNADHIRSMTDEELVEFIYYHKQEACFCCELTETDGSCTETLCINATLRWLKQPYKEEV